MKPEGFSVKTAVSEKIGKNVIWKNMKQAVSVGPTEHRGFGGGCSHGPRPSSVEKAGREGHAGLEARSTRAGRGALLSFWKQRTQAAEDLALASPSDEDGADPGGGD